MKKMCAIFLFGAVCQFGFSNPIRDGQKMFRDKNYPVYIDTDGVKVEKYLLLDDGKKLDLREYFLSKLDEERRQYGNLSVRLHKKLSNMKDDDSIEVGLNFKIIQRLNLTGSRQTSFIDGMAERKDAFARGKSKLKLRLGKSLPDSFSGRPYMKKRLSKFDILTLKNDIDFSEISLPFDSLPQTVTYDDLGGSFNTPSTGGLNISSICGYYCGSRGNGTSVGITEPNPISTSDISAYLNGSWFAQRPGVPQHLPIDHGLKVCGLIRNSYGTNNSLYEYGGSGSLSSLNFATNMNGDILGDSYHWIVNAGSSITSTSWGYKRYTSAGDFAQNEFERILDIQSTIYPQVINFESAGNSRGVTEPENIACVAPGFWTTADCDRVVFWNHNSIIVGGIDQNKNLISWSSGTEGPWGDEAPHIVARGVNIQLPWMKPYGTGTSIAGTSFSAPILAAAANDLTNKYSYLTGSADGMRAILMASSTPLSSSPGRWPTYGGESGYLSGAGLPDFNIAATIAANRNFAAASYSTSAYGFQWWDTWAPTGNSETETISIYSSTSGYIQFWLSWNGNPVNHPAGTLYPADDLDLTVSASGLTTSSVTSRNSTEHVSMPISAGTTPFTVTRTVYAKNSDPSSQILATLAWRWTATP